jgi:hypothetical protein
MPPDGYNTVTLPYDLLSELDGLNNMSRAATIRMLLAEYRADTPTPVATKIEEIHEQLDRIESAATTAESRTASIERTLENMGGR